MFRVYCWYIPSIYFYILQFHIIEKYYVVIATVSIMNQYIGGGDIK